VCLTLLAGLTFGYERRYEFSDRIAALVEGIFLDEEIAINAKPLGLSADNLERGLAIIPMRNAGTLTSLVGVPDFTRVQFDLPKTVTARSGELVLEVAGRLDDQADAVLRVSVNGERRSAVLLGPGAIHRKLVLPLSTRELAARSLNVALSAEGNAPSAQCQADAPKGLVLQVLPSSHLSLQLTEPVTDPADLLLLAGAPARVAWPAVDTSEQALALSTAFRLSEGTKDILFSTQDSGGPALSLKDIAALSDQLPEPAPRPAADRADLAAALGQRRTQDFTTVSRWRMPFDADTLKGRASAVDLALKYVSAEQSDATWLMSVYLNDRLIHAQRTKGASGDIVQTLPLPETLMERNNVLTVTLRSGERQSGVCPADTPSVADLGTARLITTDRTADRIAGPGAETPTPLVALGQLLQNGANVQVPDALSLLGGQVALDALKGLSELGLQVRTVAEATSQNGVAQITIVQSQGLRAILDGAQDQGGPVWIAYRSLEEDGAIVTQQITDDSVIDPVELPRSILVISRTAIEDNA